MAKGGEASAKEESHGRRVSLAWNLLDSSEVESAEEAGGGGVGCSQLQYIYIIVQRIEGRGTDKCVRK